MALFFFLVAIKMTNVSYLLCISIELKSNEHFNSLIFFFLIIQSNSHVINKVCLGHLGFNYIGGFT